MGMEMFLLSNLLREVRKIKGTWRSRVGLKEMKSILGSLPVVSLRCQDFKGTCQGYFGKQRLLLAGMHRIPCQTRSAGAELRGSCGLVGNQDEKVISEPSGTPRASLGSLGWGLTSSLQFPPAGCGSGGVISSFAPSQGQGEGFSQGPARLGRETSSTFPSPPGTAPVGPCGVLMLGKTEHSHKCPDLTIGVSGVGFDVRPTEGLKTLNLHGLGGLSLPQDRVCPPTRAHFLSPS